MEGMLSSGGDHSGLVHGNICILRKVLALLLFGAVDGQRKDWIDVLIELCDVVVVDVGLANIAVSV